MALFLEFTSRDLLDEDASVEALEQLAATLQDLPEAEKRELASLFRVAGADYPDAVAAKFVADLPESLGLI